MSVEVTVRHVGIDKKLQEYARDKGDALREEFPRVEYVHVIIDKAKHLQVAEVIVQGKNHVRVDATESCDQLKASIDMAFDKVERQLRKARDKVQAKRKHKASNKSLPAPAADDSVF